MLLRCVILDRVIRFGCLCWVMMVRFCCMNVWFMFISGVILVIVVSVIRFSRLIRLGWGRFVVCSRWLYCISVRNIMLVV